MASAVRRSRPIGVPLAVVGLLVAVVVLGVRAMGSGRSGDPAGEPADGRNATVTRVVDGDTVVVRVAGSDESVRLIGIDTPESVAEHRPVECYGPEASERLGQLLPPGTPVRLERDVEPRDRYGRLLAYVYRVDDGMFVNYDQVAQGFAEARSYPPNTALATDFAVAQSSARAVAAGLWGACP